MFRIPLQPPHQHTHPWLLSRMDRLAMFYSRPIRVAYYSDRPNDSSFRYRCYAPADLLTTMTTDVSASWFHEFDGAVLAEVFRDADAVVVHRSDYTADLDHLIGIARRRGVPVLFDCDDLMFDTSLISVVMSTLAQPMTPEPEAWNTWFRLVGRTEATARLCDGFIGSTRQLVDEAQATLGLPGHVVPNVMTRDQIDYSDRLVRSRSDIGDARDGRFTIGYFSGTPTHVKDIAIAAEGLRTVLRRRPDVSVRLVGYMTAEQAGLDDFEDQVEELGFTDYVSLQRLIAETEITIAPLQDNRFTRCKSELKWFDPAAVSIPTLVSPTTSMVAAVTDGEDAIVVPPGDWAGALLGLIDDYEVTGRRIGEQARRTVADLQDPERVTRMILEACGLTATVVPAA